LIEAKGDVSWSPFTKGSRIEFSTTADGASSPTERLRIGSAGQIGLGGANYGTSGQVITSNGSGSAPTWQDAGGGAWNLLSTVTASGASTVDFTSDIDSTYRTYVITGSEVIGSVDGQRLRLRFYVNGTINTSSHYWCMMQLNRRNSSTIESNDPALSYANISEGGDGIGRGLNMVKITIDNPSASKSRYRATVEVSGNKEADMNTRIGILGMDNTSAYTNVDGVRLYPDSGTITGTFKLYGIN